MASARKARPLAAAGDEDGWMSLNEAATLLGTSYHRVIVRAARGEFKTKVFAGRTWVDREAVEQAAAVKAEA